MTIELRVLCEGATEQNFVTQVLAPHLSAFDVYPRAEPLARGRSGGVSFHFIRAAIKRDVGRSRPHQHVTTMIDLYGLGQYPGAERQAGESPLQRALRIEERMAEALPNNRFIPYIQIHEFEALVFVDQKSLAGPTIAARIGVANLRASCPHLGAWITRLESLSNA